MTKKSICPEIKVTILFSGEQLMNVLGVLSLHQGAFWGLVIGLVVGCIRMSLDFIYPAPLCYEEDERPGVLKYVHYLYFSTILSFITMLIVIVISLATEEPKPEQVKQLLAFNVIFLFYFYKSADAGVPKTAIYILTTGRCCIFQTGIFKASCSHLQRCQFSCQGKHVIWLFIAEFFLLTDYSSHLVHQARPCGAQTVRLFSGIQCWDLRGERKQRRRWVSQQSTFLICILFAIYLKLMLLSLPFLFQTHLPQSQLSPGGSLPSTGCAGWRDGRMGTMTPRCLKRTRVLWRRSPIWSTSWTLTLLSACVEPPLSLATGLDRLVATLKGHMMCGVGKNLLDVIFNFKYFLHSEVTNMFMLDAM